MRTITTILGALLMTACGQSSPPVESGVSLELAEHRAATLSGIHYTLRFEIPRDSQVDITARVTIDFELSDNASSVQLDFREDKASIESVHSNGDSSQYQFLEEHIILPASALRIGHNSIVIKFTAGSSSLNRNPDYLYTLFVPDRARTAFPLFDQPDLKATYDLTLLVPDDWVAISNAPLASVTHGDNGTEYKFERTDLISSYLFSFVAGKFESVTRQRDGRSLTLLHRETEQEKVTRNLDAVFDLHWSSIDWMEQYTGIDYPFQKFDFALIPAFQYGGMEHVGAILYRASSLFLEESPSEDQLLSRASLIAHETAHMWFGNLVTMQWFNDVWTKEVFASFMAGKIINPGFPSINHDLNFLLDHYPAAYAVDRSPGANPIRQALPNLSDAGQMYGAIIYHKAPIMMRQLELLLGEDLLREGLREYLQTYAFANATWPGLIRILDAKTDEDLHAWSQGWVGTAGRPEFSIENADEFGYGLYQAHPGNLDNWDQLNSIEKASSLINLYENLLSGSLPGVEDYYLSLLAIIPLETNQLVIRQLLDQVSRLHISFLNKAQRHQTLLERVLWQTMQRQDDSGMTRMFFEAFSSLAESPAEIQKLYQIWTGDLSINKLILAENDYIKLSQILAIRLPEQSEAIISTQLKRIENSDNRRKLEFLTPSLSGNTTTRDAFFSDLADEKNRRTENWVLEALANLHHPSRIAHSEKYILPSLALLQDIQVTGDIFFPTGWLTMTLRNHHSSTAIETVELFLQERPDYSQQLRMKVLQAVDMPARANAIRAKNPVSIEVLPETSR